MALDLRLVDKGRGEPRDALAQEGKVHVGLGAQYATELGDHGWSATDTAGLDTHVAQLEAAMGAQLEARSEAENATGAESVAIDGAKGFLRQLRNALPRALREAPDAGVKMGDFAVPEGMNRSTPKISKYLATIRPSVVKLTVMLKGAFKGGSAVAVLDQVKAALDEADTTQELARKNAPDQTQALYELMGRVLEGIEDMNRAGRSAFDGDAQTGAKFNKDVLLRGRKGKKAAVPGPAAVGGAATGAAAGGAATGAVGGAGIPGGTGG